MLEQRKGSVYKSISTEEIERLTCVSNCHEVPEESVKTGVTYGLAIFDSVLLKERFFIFEDECDVNLAECLLPGAQGIASVRRLEKSISNQKAGAAQDKIRATPAIDLAQPEDIAAIVAIDVAQWGRWANTYPLYRQLLELFPSCITVARGLKGETIAFGVGIINVKTQEGFVLSVDVAKDYRGCGAGKEILSALLNRMKEDGCTKITAIIAPDNTSSMALFSSFGFLPSTTEPDYFGPGHTQIRYRLEV